MRKWRIGSKALVLLVGCNSDGKTDEALVSCPNGIRTAALHGATRGWYPETVDGSYLPSVGAIVDAAGDVICSGSLIADAFVLTAAHCARDESLWFATEGAGGVVSVLVLRHHEHDHADLALLELAEGFGLKYGVRPLPVRPDVLDERWIGRLVTLGGLGESDDGTRGERLFVVEPIVEVRDDSVFVDGKGVTGACAGDSGGPIVDLAEDGAPIVVGVLTGGSTSCTGIDQYLRADIFYPWMAEVIARYARNDCGDLDEIGRCSGQGPRWCEDGSLRGQACTGKLLCGFNAVGQARCVDSERDACVGVGQEWTCLGDDLVRCASGYLERMACGDCGMQCRSNGDEAGCE